MSDKRSRTSRAMIEATLILVAVLAWGAAMTAATMGVLALAGWPAAVAFMGLAVWVTVLVVVASEERGA